MKLVVNHTSALITPQPPAGSHRSVILLTSQHYLWQVGQWSRTWNRQNGWSFELHEHALWHTRTILWHGGTSLVEQCPAQNLNLGHMSPVCVYNSLANKTVVGKDGEVGYEWSMRGRTTTRSAGRRHRRRTMAEDRSYWWRRPCTFRWHPHRSTLIEMEDWKSLVAGLLWWGGREGGAILTDLWPPITCILCSAWLSIAMFVHTFFTLALMTTEAFSQILGYFPSSSW